MPVISAEEAIRSLDGKQTILFLVVSDNFEIAEARIYIRLGLESKDRNGIIIATNFKSEDRVVKMPNSSQLAIPVYLKPSYYTTFIELVDASTGLTCIISPRHGHTGIPMA